MDSKILLTASAVIWGAMGIGLTFLPEEIVLLAGEEASPMMLLFAQIAGALLLGFGVLNWMLKNTPVGGIYGKPLLLANLIQSLMISIVLWKLGGTVADGVGYYLLSITNTLLCTGFAWITFVGSKQTSNA